MNEKLERLDAWLHELLDNRPILFHLLLAGATIAIAAVTFGTLALCDWLSP